MHTELRTRVNYTVKIGRWTKRVRSTSIARFNLPGDCVIPAGSHRDPGRPVIDDHLISTAALIAWQMSVPATNRICPHMKDLVAAWFGTTCEKALVAHVKLGTGSLIVRVGPTTTMTISVDGDMGGWQEIVSCCSPALQQLWAIARNAPAFRISPLYTILQFACEATVSTDACTSDRLLMEQFRAAMHRHCLVPLFDKWVCQVYKHDLTSESLPILQRSEHTQRLRNKLDPGTAWSTLERSRLTHLSITHLLRANVDRKELSGLATINGTRWAALEFDTYVELQQSVFEGLVKLNMCADPSTYQGGV